MIIAPFMRPSHTSGLLYYRSCRHPQCGNIGKCHMKEEEIAALRQLKYSVGCLYMKFPLQLHVIKVT